MKKWFPVLRKRAIFALWTGFWTTTGGGAAWGLWLLAKAYTPAIAATVSHTVSHWLPTQKGLLSLSHYLYWICIPLLVIPFSYTLLKESFYVDRMYVLRDLLEAKKIKPEALTPEQHHFIYVHWPDLF